MKMLRRLTLALVLLAVGVWLWTVFFPRPETVIRKHLDKMAALLTFTVNEGQLARLVNVQQFVGFFSPDAELVVDSPPHLSHTFSGRDEILQASMLIRSAVSGLKVELLDSQIKLSPDQTEAIVDTTGQARVSGDRDRFVQELKINFRKVDSTWLIVRIETVRTLN